MQKQEVKSKRRSSELEGPASWREHRAMISHHGRRAARERQVTVLYINTLFLYFSDLVLSTLMCVSMDGQVDEMIFIHMSSAAVPTREAWLWGPSFPDGGLLPRVPAIQSRLSYTVIVLHEYTKSTCCLYYYTSVSTNVQTALTDKRSR